MHQDDYGEKTLLYYPTIKITDGYWLRNAILYWDKVASIVPGHNFEEFNSIEVEYLKDAEIYEPIYPIEIENCKEECTILCEEVREKIKQSEPLSVVGDRRFQEKNNIYRIHREKMDIHIRDMLHVNKMPSNLLEYFLEEGLAMEDGDGPWINMKADYAELYMAILAKHLAKVHGNTEIGTDQINKFKFPYTWARGRKDVERQLYLDVAMQNILPVPELDVPLQEILEFKVNYKKQLQHFRKRMENIQRILKKCNEKEEVIEEIRFFRKEIDDELMEIEEMMRNRMKKCIRRSLRTLIPIGILSGTGLVGLLNDIPPLDVWAIETSVNVATAIIGERTASISFEKQLDANNAYLFYAKRSGMIRRHQ